MKTILITVGIILLVAIVGVITNYSIDSNKEDIKEWAIEKGLEIKNIEVHFTQFDTPFYYVNKGSYIYEVDMTNGEKWWVRTSMFGNDYEKQK